jgi:Carbon-nitrogen hydrolase
MHLPKAALLLITGFLNDSRSHCDRLGYSGIDGLMDTQWGPCTLEAPTRAPSNACCGTILEASQFKTGEGACVGSLIAYSCSPPNSTGLMLVAVTQICSTPSIARNLVICRGIIDRAAKKGAKLVYLPEASDFIAPTAEVFALSSPLHPNVFVDGIREQARKSDTWVGVGVHEIPVWDATRTQVITLLTVQLSSHCVA